jgi:hypothetical protein
MIIWALIASASCAAIGQPPTSSPQARLGSAVPVALGSIVALTGPWKFHIGDDPRWADPDFDDSTWEQYDLAPGIENLTPERALRLTDLPGWQHHGHPRYFGYAWYRIQLKIRPDSGQLALLMPALDDAYEIYLNGRLVGRFGKLDGFQLTYLLQAQLFPIPSGIARIGQPNTLAIRFWSMPWEGLPRRPEVFGGLRGLPVFGSSELLTVFKGSLTGEAPLQVRLALVLNAVAGLVSIFLFLFSREQREYLWAGVALCSWALMSTAVFLGFSEPAYFSYQLVIAIQAIGSLAGVFSMPLAAMYLLGVPRKMWKRANYFVSFLNLVRVVVSLGVIYDLLPPDDTFERIDAFLKLTFSVLGILLVLIAIDGLRTMGRKAWLPITPGLFYGARFAFNTLTDADFVTLSSGMVHLLTISGRISDVCFAPSVLIIFLLRFTQQQRENGRLLEDMRQAREVQRLMIPEQLPQVPWLEIESEYLPAREVGGDFFQIIPVAADGSVLIVAGDVTGHGLQAGMLVALIVGAITTEATHSADPLKLLHSLNGRLCARGHSQATCLAIRIFPNGTATLANAGHLPPYLNGKELPMDGALPLGMVAAPSFSTLEFDFNQSDQILLISDGVVEAQNDGGQLFGFERIRHLLASQRSARDLAAAAAQFGQEDDITVLSITRTKSRREALA